MFITLLPYTRRVPSVALNRAGEKTSFIFEMIYCSARDELFFTDFNNKVVRAVHLRDNAGDMHDVYKVRAHLYCVLHERLGHTACVF